MTINKIYSKYKVLPNLQLHMLRVTAVAQQIAENINHVMNQKPLAKACLLHDIGNIIKFKLDLFPEFLEPEGLSYWEQIKEDYITKYGNDEHKASLEIAKEIGVNQQVLDIISCVGFDKAWDNLASSNFDGKIAAYADQRVGLSGIISLEDRMELSRDRFRKNKNISELQREEYDKQFEHYAEGLRQIENQIFQSCKIRPEEITDSSSEEYINKFKNFKIA